MWDKGNKAVSDDGTLLHGRESELQSVEWEFQLQEDDNIESASKHEPAIVVDNFLQHFQNPGSLHIYPA